MKNLLTLLVFLVSLNVNAVEEWRTPEPENLVYLQLNSGVVIIELAPFMAPKHVEQFRALVKEGFYDGLDFYRVIDGFVAQGGDMTEQKPSIHKAKLTAEFTRRLSADSSFLLVQSPDFMAPQTGFLNGFPAGRDPQSKEEWLLHCPGAVAMARDVDANSGTTDFYFTIGQATRHLDRNMSVFGRVIYGMPAVQALNRANINNPSGVIEDKTKRSLIISAKLATDIPSAQRVNVQVQNERAQTVTLRLASARLLDNDFFYFKGNGNLDVCYYQLKSRLLD
ncbi:MAG: peptidylprolyl isomerase [Paraglaciecola sp.]|jgi:peptidylprolyl isomerase